MIVVDAGVIVAAICDHPLHAAAHALWERDSDWVAPVLWRSEVRNVIGLKLCIQAQIISIEEAIAAYQDALELLSHGTKEVDPMSSLRTILKYGLSGYDAEYVTLAQDQELDLITTDKRMFNKLKAGGFTTVQLL